MYEDMSASPQDAVPDAAPARDRAPLKKDAAYYRNKRLSAPHYKQRKVVLIVLMLSLAGLLLAITGLWLPLLGAVVAFTLVRGFMAYHWRRFR